MKKKIKPAKVTDPKTPQFIIHDLRSTLGGGEASRIFICVHVNTGETEVVVEKTISERYSVKHLDAAMDLYERLNCGAGRKVWSLEDMAHDYNPDR